MSRGNLNLKHHRLNVTSWNWNHLSGKQEPGAAQAVLSDDLFPRAQLNMPVGVSKMDVKYPLQLSSISQDHAAVYQESIQNPEQFWADLGRRRLKWFREFDQAMDCDMDKGEFKWFSGGKINVSGILQTKSTYPLHTRNHSIIQLIYT